MSLPLPIYKNKKLTVSADGSSMFYSLEYKEAYRAKSVGAFTESLHKFVMASGAVEKAKDKDIRILDLCFGLGYNCAVTFEYMLKNSIKNRVHVVSVEKDSHLYEIVHNLSILWPVRGYRTVRSCLINGNSDNFSMQTLCMEALKAIHYIDGKFDVIYFDPFSASKNPEMWTADVFSRMRELLSDDGVLVTYACGKKARGAMAEAGLLVKESPTAAGAFQPGTIAVRV